MFVKRRRGALVLSHDSQTLDSSAPKHMLNKKRPIGIFDSGLGGLTVFKALRRQLPGEDIIYFGDTARVPYGTKSPEAVIAFSEEIAAFLFKKKIKLLVVACNTASSLALDEVRRISPVPVLGVILPGVEAALKAAPRGGRILVTGTSATVKSRAYSRALAAAGAGVRVTEKACPLFVPLVEEGWCGKPVALTVAREYLSPFRKKNIDALILGCTPLPHAEERHRPRDGAAHVHSGFGPLRRPWREGRT